MADAVIPAVTTAASATSAAASGALSAALSGADSHMIVLGAVVGAALSVWSRKNVPFEPTTRWFRGAVVHALVSVVTGVVGSTMVMSIAPGYDMLRGLALAPQWSWSVALAAGAHHLFPILLGAVSARLGAKEAGNAR